MNQGKRRQKEEELARSLDQALKLAREKSMLLSVMSHEIRTSLNAILGMVRLLQRSDADQETNENLGLLRFSAESLMSLVNDILTFSKIEEGKMPFEKRPFRLADQVMKITGSMQPQARERKLELQASLSGELPEWVMGDPLRLGQILNNLLGNAIKFTHEGSVILRVSLQQQSGPVLQIGFLVEDTGIGLDAEQVEEIFRPFTQGHLEASHLYGGSGLGLYITRQLIEAMGGSITVRSIPGQGTRFHFSLPFEKCSQESLPDQPVTLNALPAKLLVLLIEDSAMGIVLAKKIFLRWKIDLDIAEEGRVALEKISTKPYDLILLDLQIPDPDGFQVMKQIREDQESLNAGTPVVAFTASTEPEIHQQAIGAGMDDVLVKPYQPEELLAVIMKHASKHQRLAKEEAFPGPARRFLRNHPEALPDVVAKLEWLAALLDSSGEVPDAGQHQTIRHQIMPLYQSLGMTREAEKMQEYFRLVHSFAGPDRRILFRALRREIHQPVMQLLDLTRRILAGEET